MPTTASYGSTVIPTGSYSSVASSTYSVGFEGYNTTDMPIDYGYNSTAMPIYYGDNTTEVPTYYGHNTTVSPTHSSYMSHFDVQTTEEASEETSTVSV